MKMTVIVVAVMTALLMAADYAGAQEVQGPGGEPMTDKVSAADAEGQKTQAPGMEKFSDQSIDQLKPRLDKDLRVRLAEMETNTAQMRILQDQNYAARVALEKDLAAKQRAFYDTLKTKPLGERPAAYAAFLQQQIETRKSFAGENRARYEALRQSFKNAREERQKRDANLPH